MLQNILFQKEKDTAGENITARFFDFLETYKASKQTEINLLDYEEDKKEDTFLYYHSFANFMRKNEKTTMLVDIKHLFDYDTQYDLREAIISDFHRFYPFLNRAVEIFMKKYHAEWASKRSFDVAMWNIPAIEKLRDLRTEKIGRLISICGTITRSSEVKPELVYGAFKCKICGTLIRNIEQQFRFTEPNHCTNQNCNNRFKWDLDAQESRFADWQKIRVQENSGDIPPGSMPRSIDIILKNHMVEVSKPGDKCIFTGYLMVVPDIISLAKPGEKVQHQLKREAVRKEESKPMDGVSGLKNLGIRDLAYKLIFNCQFVGFVDKKKNPLMETSESEEQNVLNINAREREELIKMKSEMNIYSKLSECIAPSVYAHHEIKRGILLMLFGGVNKTTPEGIKLRGDINICIVGDPSTAKSQFLKYVTSAVPRAVYTSGKGSSAAGLTASVMRDNENGEFCIEAGALMLADEGICCIDEFDKMDSRDQVAIHEAMEQQTISIAKAGIQATLMARTSILAASNPVFGRYDKTKPLKFNIDISAPIMSRFDLFFIVLDEQEEMVDYHIAEHIVNLHKNGDSDQVKTAFSQAQFQLYLRAAKGLKPKITKAAAERLREEYRMLRQSDVSYQKTAYRITVRQLESLIRLSEALAKIHFDENIIPAYVEEASRLLKKSIINVDMPDIEIENFSAKVNEQRMQYVEQRGANVMDIDDNPQDTTQTGVARNKIVLHGAEYEKYKTAILHTVKLFESQDLIAKHKDIIEYYLENNLENIESEEQANELTIKLNAVIERLINNEGILIITAENDNKQERGLSINVNYDTPLLG